MPFKNIFFSILTIFFAQLTLGQLCFPVKKVYAYFQPVTKGIDAKGETGKNQQERMAIGNYFIYLKSKKADISLSRAWIDGSFRTGDLKIVSSPVMLSQPKGPGPYMNAQPIELVPATKMKTMQLVFGTVLNSRLNEKPPVKYENKAIVLELKYKNKTKYLVADSLIILPTFGLN